MARATTSLPVPLSPVISTESVVGAMAAASFVTCSKASEWPTSFGRVINQLTSNCLDRCVDWHTFARKCKPSQITLVTSARTAVRASRIGTPADFRSQPRAAVPHNQLHHLLVLEFLAELVAEAGSRVHLAH